MYAVSQVMSVLILARMPDYTIIIPSMGRKWQLEI
jgi:hypothetical protein